MSLLSFCINSRLIGRKLSISAACLPEFASLVHILNMELNKQLSCFMLSLEMSFVPHQNKEKREKDHKSCWKVACFNFFVTVSLFLQWVELAGAFWSLVPLFNIMKILAFSFQKQVLYFYLCTLLKFANSNIHKVYVCNFTPICINAFNYVFLRFFLIPRTIMIGI